MKIDITKQNLTHNIQNLSYSHKVRVKIGMPCHGYELVVELYVTFYGKGSANRRIKIEKDTENRFSCYDK
jgi:hypothetical protein